MKMVQMFFFPERGFNTYQADLKSDGVSSC